MPGQTKRAAGYKGEKVITDSLRRALQRRANGKSGPRNIELMTQALVKKAINGDIAAIKEVTDRVQGRAVQPHDLGDTGPLTVEIMRFTAAPAEPLTIDITPETVTKGRDSVTNARDSVTNARDSVTNDRDSEDDVT